MVARSTSLCTSAVDELIPDADGLLNQDGHPKALWGDERHAGLFFAGFDGYALGGLLRSIRLEAPQIATRIAERMAPGQVQTMG